LYWKSKAENNKRNGEAKRKEERNKYGNEENAISSPQ
jgi:hypothetical protein